MTLVLGLVVVILMLFLMAVRVVDLVEFFKLGRSSRATDVAMRTIRVLDPQTHARLTELVEEGSKIQAIKDLRVATGLRPKEAEEVVRYLAQGFLPQYRHIPARTEERARELFAQGRGIKAIKLIRRRRWPRRSKLDPPKGLPRPVRPIRPQTLARLTELARQRNRIEAAMGLMMATGLGPQEALDAVDALAAGQDTSGLILVCQDIPASVEERARELIVQGRKVEAIMLISEETRLGHKEAMDVADGLSELQAGRPD